MVEVFEVLEPTSSSSLSPSLTNPVACVVTNAKGYAADMFQNVAVGHQQLDEQKEPCKLQQKSSAPQRTASAVSSLASTGCAVVAVKGFNATVLDALKQTPEHGLVTKTSCKVGERM